MCFVRPRKQQKQTQKSKVMQKKKQLHVAHPARSQRFSKSQTKLVPGNKYAPFAVKKNLQTPQGADIGQVYRRTQFREEPRNPQTRSLGPPRKTNGKTRRVPRPEAVDEFCFFGLAAEPACPPSCPTFLQHSLLQAATTLGVQRLDTPSGPACRADGTRPKVRSGRKSFSSACTLAPAVLG